MGVRILTKNGIENTNIDGARDNNFNAGRRSGIVKGALNEGNLYGTSNTLTLEPGELRICGHRVVIDENENRTFTNKPQTATKQSLIGQIQVDGDNVIFELIVQNNATTLVQDNLDINGSGTYQLEIGTFTQNTDGTISNVVRTAELISGSIYNLGEDFANTELSNIKVNINITEVVYDMTSSSSSKNWGYTSGIQGGTTVSGKNFSKYNKLIIYYTRNFSQNLQYSIDLKLPKVAEYGSTGVWQLYDQYGMHFITSASQVSLDKTAFMHRQCGISQGTNFTQENNTTNFVVYKIEGVY